MTEAPGGLFGRIALHQNYVTPAQLNEALQIHGQYNATKHLGEILIERGYLTQDQVSRILQIQAQVEAKMAGRPSAPSPVAATTPPPEPEPPPLPEIDMSLPDEDPEDNPADWLAPAHDFVGDVQTGASSADLLEDPLGRDAGPAIAGPAQPNVAAAPTAQAAPPPQAAPVQTVPAQPAQQQPPVPQSAPAPTPQPAAAQSAAPVQPPQAAAAQSAAPVQALEQLLLTAARYGASDVHYHTGYPVIMRLNGNLLPGQGAPLSAEQTERDLLSLLNGEQRAQFLQTGDLDFACDIQGMIRCRVNYCRALHGGIDGVFRLVPKQIPNFQHLSLPTSIAKMTTYRQGIVLFTGPAGCGKTTTLAAVVDILNSERKEHILTVEDPIEFVHPSKQCLVNQRQVRSHTETFSSALRSALREDPDIIVVGELRDEETISLALSAAETGHLVLGTLHTNNSVRTITRLVDAFPASEQSQIRAMVAESLRAVVSQTLIQTTDGSRRIPAVEILIGTPAIGNLIRDSKTFQIPAVMQVSRNHGMVLLDDAMDDLVKAGVITKEAARPFAEKPARFA